MKSSSANGSGGRRRPASWRPCRTRPSPASCSCKKLTPEQHAQALSDQPDLPSQPTTEKSSTGRFTAEQITVLFEEELPEKKMFRYRAITGKRDRNAGTWFGLVRPMRISTRSEFA